MMKYKLIILMLSLMIQGVAFAKKKPSKDDGYKFTNLIEVATTPVKDQANSGTCWSYATTSFIETELMRLGHDTLDLSEMYFVYYAYKQKAKKYLRYHGLTNFSQGGQGHDVMNVVSEFGMLPESAYAGLNYGTAYHKHSEMVNILAATLDESLKQKDGFTGKALDIIDATLSIYLGDIPETFTYNEKEYSPSSFTSELGFNADDYIELTSYDCYPYYNAVDLELPDNWSHDAYYNVPLEVLMQIVDTSFAMGYSVNWDGDVSEPGFSHSNGVAIVPENDPKDMDDSERLKWESLSEEDKNELMYSFDHPIKEKTVTNEMRQKDFDTFRTTDDHLMHLVGTAKDQNGTTYYITKNSWADDSNSYGGKLYMSRSFIQLKTTAIQVHKDVIPEYLKAKLGL